MALRLFQDHPLRVSDSCKRYMIRHTSWRTLVYSGLPSCTRRANSLLNSSSNSTLHKPVSTSHSVGSRTKRCPFLNRLLNPQPLRLFRCFALRRSAGQASESEPLFLMEAFCESCAMKHGKTNTRVCYSAEAGIWRFPILLILQVLVCAATLQSASAQGQGGVSRSAAPLTTRQVVEELAGMNLKRAQALHSYHGTRIYRLEYRGFPGSRSAEMVVDVKFRAPGTKEFTVRTSTGSRLILDKVFGKLLEAEENTNVTVTLSNITHTFPDDWDILLVGPTAANLIILSDVGGSDDVTNRTITLDDAAAATIPDSTTLNSGTFRPTNIGAGDTFPAPAPAPSANTTLASTFNGTNPNGTWSLYLVDDLGADMGVISNGWSLNITTDMTSATSFSNGVAIHGGDGARSRATPYASSIVSNGLTGAITSVTVTLNNINHLNPDDIDIILVGPSGKRIVLLSDAGGTGDVINQTLTFDDAAAATVPDAGPMVSGHQASNFGTGDTLPDQLPPYPNSATAGSSTLTSVFGGTQPNGTWRLYVVDDATTSAGDIMGGWSIDITAAGTFGSKRITNGDFDGDGKTDVAQFRGSDHSWYSRYSNDFSNNAYLQFGSSGDVLTPGDYDGDGKTDFAVFRPLSGRWFIIQSLTNTLRQVAWGTSGDLPIPADYDGDGNTDPAVYRDGVWHILQSITMTARVVSWGLPSDAPVPGYYNGTPGVDFAVFRASENNWYILNNAGSMSRVENFGVTGDRLVPADYDGDSKTDLAVWRDSTGDFYILQSSTSTVLGRHWGAMGDLPVPGDYDGDSRVDVAVWRPSTGSWYLLNSGTPPGTAAIRIDNWGQFGDLPVPYLYLSRETIP